MVTEPMTHWWKPLNLQYYELGVCGDIPGKNHKWGAASPSPSSGWSTREGRSIWCNRLALQLICVWSGVLFFNSKRLLGPNKQRKGRLRTVKVTSKKEKETFSTFRWRHTKQKQTNKAIVSEEEPDTVWISEKWGPKTRLPFIAIGAATQNETEIFEIVTSRSSFWVYSPHFFHFGLVSQFLSSILCPAEAGGCFQQKKLS